MKKVFLLVLFFIVLANTGFSQALSTYNLSFPAGTYTPIVGTVPPRTFTGGASSGAWDDASCNNIPIGFNFTYVGNVYNSISANTNGWIVLGQNISNALTTVSYQNDLSNGGGTNQPRPILAAFWDDLYETANPFQYTTIGAVGSRPIYYTVNRTGFLWTMWRMWYYYADI